MYIYNAQCVIGFAKVHPSEKKVLVIDFDVSHFGFKDWDESWLCIFLFIIINYWNLNFKYYMKT